MYNYESHELNLHEEMMNESTIFELTERLSRAESEVNRLRKTNEALESQLALRGHLDSSYQELLDHVKQSDEEHRLERIELSDRYLQLELKNERLIEAIEEQRTLLGDQEEDIAQMRRREHTDAERMQHQIELVREGNSDLSLQNDRLRAENNQMGVEISRLEADLRDEQDSGCRQATKIQHLQQNEIELENEIARHQANISIFQDQIQQLREENRQLREENEVAVMSSERYREHREDVLNQRVVDVAESARQTLDDVAESARQTLNERDKEIELLNRQMDRYEDILDEADFVTHEQQTALKQNKQEIVRLSKAIERIQATESGFLAKLDRLCSVE
mmetsp:Transcript_32757/g.78223  ORF Transcript_32757/g.78223 Transcript_32757/m.78223 type:complete len:336 (+) Transcript_32757:74-1081(+)